MKSSNYIRDSSGYVKCPHQTGDHDTESAQDWTPLEG